LGFQELQEKSEDAGLPDRSIGTDNTWKTPALRLNLKQRLQPPTAADRREILPAESSGTRTARRAAQDNKQD
jgi:hypothetical protein